MGNVATVHLLLDAGARVNAADERGFTALMMACHSRTKGPSRRRVAARPWCRCWDQGQVRPHSGGLGRNRGSRQIARCSWAVQEAKTDAVESSGGSVSARHRAAGAGGPGILSQIRLYLLPQRVHSDDGVGRGGQARRDTQAALQQMAKQTAAFLMPNRDDLLSGYCSIPFHGNG